MQLDLFSGDHVPAIRGRNALERGDLAAARAAFALADEGTPASRAAARIERLCAALERCDSPPDAAVGRVHAAFVAASGGEGGDVEEEMGRAVWFRVYAAHLGAALAPAQRFRGWCRVDYELGARRLRGALGAAAALVEAEPSAFAWLEKARAELAGGDDTSAQRAVIIACLTAADDLDPSPPRLAPCETKDLEAPPDALPALPRAVETLWNDALDLDLPGAAPRWVPCIGMLDGTFAPAQLASPELRAATGFDVRAAESRSDDPPREFLRALIAAREARAHERGLSTGCGPRELDARASMKRIAPALFRRYMETLVSSAEGS